MATVSKTSKAKPTAVSIKNVGRISQLDFLLEGEGGIIVFSGDCGRGKTTAIRALAGLMGSDSDLSQLTVRDGEEKGEIEGLGKKVTIGKRNTKTGSLSVPTLGSRFSIAGLVNPPFKDEDSRRKFRIRQLVSIGNRSLSPLELVGPENSHLLDLVDLDAVQSITDPVAMGDKLKRELDKTAKQYETDSEVKASLAQTRRGEAGDVDELKGEVDVAALSAAYRAATTAVEQAKNQVKLATQIDATNARIESELAELLAGYTGPELDTEEQIRESVKSQEALIASLESRLKAAKDRKAALDLELLAIDDLRKKQAMLERQKVERVPKPTDGAIAKLQDAEVAAYDRMIGAESLGKRKQALKASVDLQEESVRLEEEAQAIRKAAKLVLENVQKALPEGPIKVVESEAGQELVVFYEARGKDIPLDELSTGEMWRIALGYAAEALEADGVLTLEQEAWQSLSPAFKKELADLFKEMGVWGVTGEVSAGDLRVETV